MNGVFTILPSTTTVAQAAQFAQARGCGLYLTRHGQVIVSQIARAGWQRVCVGEKSAGGQ